MIDKAYLIYQYNTTKTDSRFLSIVCTDIIVAENKCKELNKMFPKNEHFIKEFDIIKD